MLLCFCLFILRMKHTKKMQNRSEPSTLLDEAMLMGWVFILGSLCFVWGFLLPQTPALFPVWMSSLVLGFNRFIRPQHYQHSWLRAGHTWCQCACFLHTGSHFTMPSYQHLQTKHPPRIKINPSFIFQVLLQVLLKTKSHFSTALCMWAGLC